MPRSAAKTNNRPAVRGAMSLGKPTRVRGASNVTELFDLGGRFDRNEISKSEIDQLRNMIDSDGAQHVAKLLEVCRTVVYTVAAGFGHRLNRKTAAKVRDYFRA